MSRLIERRSGTSTLTPARSMSARTRDERQLHRRRRSGGGPPRAAARSSARRAAGRARVLGAGDGRDGARRGVFGGDAVAGSRRDARRGTRTRGPRARRCAGRGRAGTRRGGRRSRCPSSATPARPRTTRSRLPCAEALRTSRVLEQRPQAGERLGRGQRVLRLEPGVAERARRRTRPSAHESATPRSRARIAGPLVDHDTERHAACGRAPPRRRPRATAASRTTRWSPAPGGFSGAYSFARTWNSSSLKRAWQAARSGSRRTIASRSSDTGHVPAQGHELLREERLLRRGPSAPRGRPRASPCRRSRSRSRPGRTRARGRARPCRRCRARRARCRPSRRRGRGRPRSARAAPPTSSSTALPVEEGRAPCPRGRG